MMEPAENRDLYHPTSRRRRVFSGLRYALPARVETLLRERRGLPATVLMRSGAFCMEFGGSCVVHGDGFLHNHFMSEVEISALTADVDKETKEGEMTTKQVFVVCLSTVVLFWAGTALALDPEPKCESAKNKIAGKLALCLQKAEAKLVKTRGACLGGGEECHRDDDCAGTCVKDTEKYDSAIVKCNDKFSEKWVSEETKATEASATCPDEPLDPNSLAEYVTECSDCVTSLLAGEATLCSCSSGSCADEGGVEVGGKCWFLGATSDGCDTTCEDAGLVYDEATRTYAGSDGTWAQCQAVMDALDKTSPEYDDFGDNGCSDGFGCFLEPNVKTRARCTSPPTDATTSAGNARRACACQ